MCTISHTFVNYYMSAEFMHVLEELMEAFPRTHLFVDSNGHALTPQGFSKWVIRSTEGLFEAH